MNKYLKPFYAMNRDYIKALDEYIAKGNFPTIIEIMEVVKGWYEEAIDHDDGCFTMKNNPWFKDVRGVLTIAEMFSIDLHVNVEEDFRKEYTEYLSTLLTKEELVDNLISRIDYEMAYVNMTKVKNDIKWEFDILYVKNQIAALVLLKYIDNEFSV